MVRPSCSPGQTFTVVAVSMGLQFPRRLCVPELWGTWDKGPMGEGLRKMTTVAYCSSPRGVWDLHPDQSSLYWEGADREERTGRGRFRICRCVGPTQPLLGCSAPRNQSDGRKGNADSCGWFTGRPLMPLPALSGGWVLSPSSAP